MSDDWAEVRTHDRRYYWHVSGQTTAEPPPGVRVVWTSEKHPETGRTYYWNKETSESVWTLPGSKTPSAAGGAGATIGSSRKRSEDWADVRDAASDQLERQMPEPSAGARLLGAINGSFAGKLSTEAGADDAWWMHGAQHAEWSDYRQRFLAQATSKKGVREAGNDAWQVLPPSLDFSSLALLELAAPVSAGSLFPADFCVAGADPEGLPAARTIAAGYVLAIFGESPYALAEALPTLARCWWGLTQAFTSFTTLLFVTALGGDGEAADAESEGAFLELQRLCLVQCPAPLLCAAHRLGGAGNRQRLLGGWNGTPSMRLQAKEWLHPGSWEWGWEPATGSSSRRARAREAVMAEAEAWDEDWNDEHWDGETEDQLVDSVTAYLASGPKEVQDLAAHFAGRFNDVVRNDPKSPYNADKKNDGSFKKWLLTLGFEASALYDRNKCLVSLPAAAVKKARSRGGRKSGSRAGEESADAEGYHPEGGVFKPLHGLGSKEAKELQNEVISYIRRHGDTDMGALRGVNDLGRRFNEVFFHKSKVNDGSWKRWLASIPGCEVVVDPKVAAFHGNKPTVVRLR